MTSGDQEGVGGQPEQGGPPASRPPAGYPAGQDEPAAPGPPPADSNPLNRLERLLWIHPITTLRIHAKLDKTFWRVLAFTADALLLLVVYAGLLVLIGLMAWKLISPVPPPPWK